jgi:hypothetical protein
VLLVLSLAVLAGCGLVVSNSPPPPMSDVALPGSFCLSTKPGVPVTIGWDLLQVQGSAPAVIRNVSLIGGSGIDLSAVLAVPVLGTAVLGNGWTYPLTAKELAELTKGVQWSKRRPAVGTTIRPSANPDVNLVAAVAPTGAAGGTATGLSVSYEAGGQGYVLDTVAGFTLLASPSAC